MLFIFSIWGTVNPPPGVAQYGNVTGAGGAGGLTLFFGNILKTVIVLGAIYSTVNIVLAGYAFLTAGADPKKVEGAWTKIWQTFLGIAIMTGAFLVAAIISRFVFGDFSTIFRFGIFGAQ